MINKLKVGQRLIVGSGLLCLLACALAWIGYREILNLRTQLDAVPEMVSSRIALSEWQGHTDENNARVVAILRSSDGSLGQVLGEDMNKTNESVTGLHKRIEAMPMSDEAKRSFEAVNEARAVYIAARDETLKAKRDRNADSARLFDTKFYPALAGYELAMQTFVDDLNAKVLADLAYAKQDSDRSIVWLAACVLLFVALAALLVWLMVRSITGPVSDAVIVADALARGDLTQRAEARGDDEIGSLMRSLGRASGQLAVLVREIQNSAATINGGAEEISNGNSQLSSRTEAQASSLEETASSMEELTATVQQNATNANQANQLVQGASEVAVRGGEVVGEVVRTMDEISTCSRKIAEITGIINGIAFQTNILALNAAVEAARAGDQGRGFAVVASEVRSLAQRSAEAAKEIKALIEDSTTKVNSGSKLAAEAGKTMVEVVASVRKVAQITGEISAASREQASGIQQVGQAVTQMDAVTQQNAALVEQVSAASASLQEQAQGLARAVAAFRIAEWVAQPPAEAGIALPEEGQLALPARAA
jgi:methyl-accepting chemotaxis protein